MAILILIFNAAKDCPTMIESLDKQTQQHYIYLRDSYPHLVPTLDHLFDRSAKQELPSDLNNCDHFFVKIFEKLRSLVLADKCSLQVQMAVLSNAIRLTCQFESVEQIKLIENEYF